MRPFMNGKNTPSIKKVSEDAGALVTKITKLKRIMDANKPSVKKATEYPKTINPGPTKFYKKTPPTPSKPAPSKTDTRSRETVKPSTPSGVILNTNQFRKY
jgi:hypothetical protein